MLLQDQDLLASLGHDCGRGHAADAAADDDRVQVFGDFVRTETLLQDGVPFLLICDVSFPGLAVIL